jgi:biopolymer transport protein ExbD
VLLIIFMVTAKLVVSRAIPMDLPRAATGGEVQQVFSVALLADGTMSIDGVPTSRDEDTLQCARQALARHRELRAVVQADGAVPHRRVMHALDVLRQAGIAHIAFSISQGPPVEAATAR